MRTGRLTWCVLLLTLLAVSAAGQQIQLELSYILQSNPNAILVFQDGTIAFGPALLNSTTQATFIIRNMGLGPATIANISLGGTAFSMTSPPMFPVTLASGTDLQIALLYKPTEVRSDTGQLTLSFPGGGQTNLNLSGRGVSS